MNCLRKSSPVPAAASVKILMAAANELQYKLYHLNVTQALAQATLDDEVYVKLPGGCGGLFGKYLRLEKAFFGLKHIGSAVERPAGCDIGYCAWHEAVQV